MPKKKIRFATKSDFKKQEVPLILRRTKVGIFRKVPADQLFEVEFFDINTDEPLERELSEMVYHKARSAYRKLMAPCVVEHAGLILEPFVAESYPGGLTQPMWDALGAEGFSRSVLWASERALARSVLGYCDGLSVKTFIGETWGRIIDTARGGRDFYWDTIFCPDGGGDLTYAEIAMKTHGLTKKVELSQFTKSLELLLRHLAAHGAAMFPDT